ncbi:MAG: S1 family peptidase [Archangium sp.]
MRSLSCLLLVAWCCACAPSQEPELAASVSQAVFNGTAAPTENQVFLLDIRTNTGSAVICSAVLVTPRVLLTAAHCVDPAFHGAASVTVRALNKPDTSNLMLSDTIVVVTIARHPMWNVADSESDYDLAALLLTSAPVNVTPAPMSSNFANPVGSMVKVVGYGRLVENMPSTSGTRRSSTLSVTAATPLHIQFGDSMNGLCVGDSGGPSFSGAEVVGIHSRTPGTALCDEGIDIRVDSHRDFIDAFIAANDPPRCTADGRCAATCTTADPDCTCVADGNCVRGCAQTDPDCSPCVADGSCGASCGSTDPDCCKSDGTCDSACGSADVDCCASNGTCGVGCGATDADCCKSDGACDSACGNTDVDCRCRAGDALCGTGCGAADSDCCRADGTCDAACGSSDVDCRCQSDGRCDDGCASVDVDCCASDGQCTVACGASDADCAPDGAKCASEATCVGGACVDGTCTRVCSDDAVCTGGATCRNGHCRTGCGCSSAEGLGLGVVWLVLRLARRRPRRR